MTQALAAKLDDLSSHTVEGQNQLYQLASDLYCAMAGILARTKTNKIPKPKSHTAFIFSVISMLRQGTEAQSCVCNLLCMVSRTRTDTEQSGNLTR